MVNITDYVCSDNEFRVYVKQLPYIRILSVYIYNIRTLSYSPTVRSSPTVLQSDKYFKIWSAIEDQKWPEQEIKTKSRKCIFIISIGLYTKNDLKRF